MEELRRLWGKNVSTSRAAFGWNQKELADRCAVTQQTISNVETGTVAPSDLLKIRIAAALNQDVHQVFPLVRTIAGVA